MPLVNRTAHVTHKKNHEASLLGKSLPPSQIG